MSDLGISTRSAGVEPERPQIDPSPSTRFGSGWLFCPEEVATAGIESLVCGWVTASVAAVPT